MQPKGINSVGEFRCPVCSGQTWRVKQEIHSHLRNIPDGLTRPPEIRVIIGKCEICGLEFNRDWLEGKDFKTLYTNNKIYSVADYAYKNGIRPKYTIDPIRILETYRKPPGDILEIGFLDTSLLEELSRHDWQVEGVDLDNLAVQHACQLGFTAFCGDIHDVYFRGKEYEVIIAFGVLEHIGQPVAFLRRVHQLLSPNGLLLLQLPHPGSLNAFLSRFSGQGWDMYCEPGHIFHYRKEHLLKLLDDHSFRILHYETSTIRIRGKIPFSPVRLPKFERQIFKLVHELPLFLWIYTLVLISLDIFQAGDTHLLIAQKIGIEKKASAIGNRTGKGLSKAGMRAR
jgi:2-polyprenyl-3-methyl-5-hydroxy-6-metoxy-1,4-benzoquinol methylase